MTQIEATTPVPDVAVEGGAPEGELAAGEQAPVSEGEGQPTSESSQPVDAGEKFIAKVNGQDIEVTREELVSGYQRQQDYTRKTQDVAAERQRLAQAEAIWTALQEDPQGTIEALNDHFRDALGTPEGDPDPVDARLAPVESYIQEQQAAAAEQAVRSELEVLTKDFGEFNTDELLQYAIDNEIGDLRAAYLHRSDANDRLKRDRDALAAKKAAPPIAGGSKAAGTTEATPIPVGEMTLDRALEAALAELGADSVRG